MKLRLAIVMTLLTASVVTPQLAAAGDDASSGSISAGCANPTPMLRREMGVLEANIAAATQSGGELHLTAEAFEALALDIERRVEAMQLDKALRGPAGSQVRLLFSDMRDGTILMRRAAHADARRVGLLKVTQDLEHYRRRHAQPDCM